MFTKFLVVDDQDADQLLAEYAITDYNPAAEIHKAFDGEEALGVLRNVSGIELILLDINMPGMNGHEFLANYHTDDPDAPVVVMLTSSDQTADRERCAQYQIVIDYLTKPLEDVDLRRIEQKVE